MALTKLAAVGDALESAAVTAVAAQSPAVPVYRGGSWLLTSSADPRFVVIGHDGSRDGGAPAAIETQEPANQGNGWRTARGDVTGAVVSQSGDTDMATRRTECETLLALLDPALRSYPPLAGLVMFGWISGVTPFEEQTGAGSVARYVWTYHYEYDI